MKNFKSTTPKALVAGFMLAGLLMTGCSANNGNKDANNTPAPSATASASATPAATPTGTPQPTSTTPGLTVPTVEATDKTITPAIDIAASLAKADPSVAKNFPAASFDVKEGVSQGFAAYQKISEIRNLHIARGADDPADSFYAEQNKNLFTGKYLPILKEQMDKQAPFPTADRDGTISANGTKFTSSGVWSTKYKSEPAITTYALDGVGVTLLISGTRMDTVITTTHQMVTVEVGYQIAVVPQGDGSWKVAGLGNKLLSASVTDAK